MLLKRLVNFGRAHVSVLEDQLLVELLNWTCGWRQGTSICLVIQDTRCDMKCQHRCWVMLLVENAPRAAIWTVLESRLASNVALRRDQRRSLLRFAHSRCRVLEDLHATADVLLCSPEPRRSRRSSICCPFSDTRRLLVELLSKAICAGTACFRSTVVVLRFALR